MKAIVIIGAGLSGTLLAMNLLKQNHSRRIDIKLIDRSGEDNLGPAYSTNEDYLLNVPAELMGAFSKDPEHFLKWTMEKKIKAGKGDYLPRKLYRGYIQEMFQQAFKEKSSGITFQRIKGEAVDIKIIDEHLTIFMEDGNRFDTGKVVLALGNAPPRNPELKSRSFLKDNRYINNPWDPNIFKDLSPDSTIFFIGSGQTTVDLAAGLFRKNHKGKMISISRRGIFPLPQKKVDPYPTFFDEIKDKTDFLTVFKIVRKHFRKAEEMGLDPRAVIDSLRPYTKNIWMHLPTEEKKRFLRHAFRYWEIIRSRIPPTSYEIIKKLISSGEMEVITGRLTDIIPSESRMEIKYAGRGMANVISLYADIVINCIGPCQDYEQIDKPLVKNLLNSRLIQCDPVHLGINALPEGNIIQEDGMPSPILFTIGLPLKGIVWESLAAPEIRVEAEELSKILVGDL
jgi:uncharacterized NAD(P)/FAD-binding protein YdhS